MSQRFDPSEPSPRGDGGGSRKRAAAGQLDHEHAGKRGAADQAPIVLLRIACPVEKSGPVIGKGGEVIRSIRDTTGARIKMDDVPRGMNERAIIIFSPDRPGEPTCAAQDALDKVIARIFDPEEAEGKPPPEKAELVLLLDRCYMGIIVGKGGEHITRIRTQSGVSVQIQARGHGSVLSGPEEETVVISGPYAGVRTAAKAVIDRVRDGVQRDHQPAATTLAIAHTGRGGLPPGAPLMQDGLQGVPPPSGPPSQSIHTVYRLLVPDARVGSIIGKGGDRLRILREQSRADVKVEKSTEGSEERLVVCGSWEPPEHEYCAAAEGLMMCANRVVMDKTALDPEGKVVLRLLAPGAQMGAVMGIQGRIIKQVSIDTGAHLVVLPGESGSRLSSAGDEILEIRGHPDQVMEATRIATMLLRGIMIRQQQVSAAPGGGSVGGQYGAPAPQQYQPYAAAPPPAPGQYSYAPAAAPATQQYSYPSAPGTAPASSQPQYDAYTATYGAPAAAPAPSSYPNPTSADPYAAYYAALGQPPPQSSNPTAYPYTSDPNAPPPQSGYSYSPPAAATNPYSSSGGNGAAAFNPYNPPASASASGAAPGAGMGPAPANPPIGSLHNPTISSAGLPQGMIRYTLSLPVAHIGTLLGTRGSNVAAIRLASGARIKVGDNTPGAQEREVEISGQPAQVSLATSAIQTLVSTGKMPSNIPH